MIRVAFGSALTVLGLGLAVAYTGPDLVTGEAGASMVVSSAEHAAFLHARFEGAACAPKLLSDTPGAKKKLHPGIKVVAFALRPDGSDLEVAIREIPGDSGAPVKTVAMLFDETGQVVTVREQPAIQAADAPQTCEDAPHGAGPV